jgi:hypothetical protein
LWEFVCPLAFVLVDKKQVAKEAVASPSRLRLYL